MMYYEEEKGTFLIFSHNKSIASLPFNGWLHNCLFCQTITSNTEDYYYRRNKLKILTCAECQKSKEKEKDNHELNLWIEDNIPKFRRF